jgi:hypothetical protein
MNDRSGPDPRRCDSIVWRCTNEAGDKEANINLKHSMTYTCHHGEAPMRQGIQEGNANLKHSLTPALSSLCLYREGRPNT